MEAVNSPKIARRGKKLSISNTMPPNLFLKMVFPVLDVKFSALV